MSIFDILTLFGGLAMFLYSMRLMGDGLKESSSGTLKKAMESVTNNPDRKSTRLNSSHTRPSRMPSSA